jgi:hypothetical protein
MKNIGLLRITPRFENEDGLFLGDCTKESSDDCEMELMICDGT